MSRAAGIEAEIRAAAEKLGFDAVGFARAELPPEAGARLRALVSAGHHGEMRWMAERMEQRENPGLLWPEVRSVISLGLSYAPEGDALATLARPDRGSLSVYARNRDYHDIIKGKLKHLAQFVVSRAASQHPEVKVFVDTAPVMEKPLAQQAGLGWQGKHSNLVSRAHGSWLFLGEIFTTLVLLAGRAPCRSLRQLPCLHRRLPDGRDHRALPAAADALHLLSHHRASGPDPGGIPGGDGQPHLWLRRLPCRLPLEPLRARGAEAKLTARADLEAPPLRELSRLDDAAFRALFAGSPIKRIRRDRFLRNVAIAIGNSGDLSLLPEVERLRGEPDPVLAEAAAWAVAKLQAAAG